MARRRLNTILATTTLAAGLSVAPAWGQSLGDVTDVVQQPVEDTTEVVQETAETAEATIEETTTGEATSTSATGDAATADADGADDAPSAPLDVDLEVDAAPEDEDGSPQLEIDGGVTVGDQRVDVGSITDPIEDVVDPDPASSPDPDDGPDGPDGHETETSSDSRDGRNNALRGAGPGGFLEGDVIAAGVDARSADAPGSGSTGGGHDQSGRTVGESFAAFAAGNRGSDWSRGATDGPDRTTSSSEIVPPQVASPAGEPFEQFPSSQVEQPTVLATPAVTGEPTSPMAGMLKSLAALMVLGTGIVLKRTLERA